MEITVKLNIPGYVYRFYKNASQCVAGCSPEKLMADALSAYAGLLSKDIAKARRESQTAGEGE